MEDYELATARLHVVRGRAIIAKQIARIESLIASGAGAAIIEVAKSSLVQFENSQLFFEEHLARIEAQHKGSKK
jgi:hypothetical protein